MKTIDCFNAKALGAIFFVCLAVQSFTQTVLLKETFEGRLGEDWGISPNAQIEKVGKNHVALLKENSSLKLHRGYDWRNYALALELKLFEGSIDINCRINERGRYLIKVDSKQLSLARELPWGTKIELIESNSQIKTNEWNYFEIICIGKTIQVYLNDELVLDFIDTFPHRKGSIAFETSNGTILHIDNIEVATNSKKIMQIKLANLNELSELSRSIVSSSFATELQGKGEYELSIADSNLMMGNLGSADHQAHKAEKYFRKAILWDVNNKIKLIEDTYREDPQKIPVERLFQIKEQYYLSEDEGIEIDEYIDKISNIKDWISMPKPSFAFPDLTIEFYDYPESNIKALHPSPPLIDQPTQVSLLAKNEGYSGECNFIARLYLDDLLAKEWNFPSEDEKLDLGIGDMLKFDMGETRLYTHAFESIDKGKHILRCTIDETNNVAELNDNNNEDIFTASWVTPPDLIITDIERTMPGFQGENYMGQYGGGQNSYWNIVIKNNSETDINYPFVTTLKPISAEGTHASMAGGRHEAIWTKSLKAQETTKINSTQGFKSWGDITFEAVVDANNNVSERSQDGEKNNTMIKTFTLEPVDFEIQNVQVSKGLFGMRIHFTCLNKSDGGGYEKFKIWSIPGKYEYSNIHLEEPAIKDFEGYVIAPLVWEINGVMPGYEFTVDYTIPCRENVYNLTIIADYDNVYNEPNEYNNIYTTQIEVDKIKSVNLTESEYNPNCPEGFNTVFFQVKYKYYHHMMYMRELEWLIKNQSIILGNESVLIEAILPSKQEEKNKKPKYLKMYYGNLASWDGEPLFPADLGFIINIPGLPDDDKKLKPNWMYVKPPSIDPSSYNDMYIRDFTYQGQTDLPFEQFEFSYKSVNYTMFYYCYTEQPIYESQYTNGIQNFNTATWVFCYRIIKKDN